MKVTLQEFLQIEKAMDPILNCKELTAVAAFKFGNFLTPFVQQKKVYEESYRKLFLKYGEEKDGQILVKPENVLDFRKEEYDLLMTEIELPDTKLELNDLEPVKITPAEIMLISKFIQM